AGLSLAYDFGQRLHRLLERRRRVVAMTLVEVDEIDTQARERSVDLLENLRPRQPAILVGHREVELRREHVGVARTRGEHLAEERLGLTAVVGVRRVDEGDAQVERR